MSALIDVPTTVQERAEALRAEIQRWLTLASQAEQHASKTQDTTSLSLIEGFLSSARKSIAGVIQTATARDYPISPVVEGQEITLPANLFPAGHGVPVQAREGGVRLPDPSFFPKE